MPADVLQLPRLRSMLDLIRGDAVYQHMLPDATATSGQALAHVLARVSSKLRQEYPCVYKFGFTHCLHFRWQNKKYGYVNDVDKYHTMICVYISRCPTGASLMESILIREHMGYLPEYSI